MKTKLSFSVIALLLSFNAINAQIKIVGDDYSEQMTASKSFYEKDVDFDKYFPSLEKEKISLIHPNLVNDIRDDLDENMERPDIHLFIGERSVYLSKNLTGDTVYLSENYDLQNTYYRYSNYIHIFKGTSFCVDSLGNAVYKTMPIGYYVISGYVFCKENVDSIRKVYALEPIQYIDYSSARIDIDFMQPVLYDDGRTLRNMQNGIIAKGKNFNASPYIRYIIFQSLSSKEKYYISPDDRFKEKNVENIFNNMISLRFYSEARSFIGSDVIIDRGDIVNVVKDGLSGNLVKLEDKYYVVKDVVMNNNKFYITLNGEKTGSFALNIRWIYGRSDKKNLIYDESKYYGGSSYYNYFYWRDASDNMELLRDPYAEGYMDIKTPSEGNVGGDIRCICVYNDLGQSREKRLSLIKRSDLAKLDRRAKIEKSQLEREWKLKDQQRKQAQAKADATFRLQMQSKYGERFGKLVANKQLALEMAQAMVRDAWGEPMNTYRTTTKYGQSEVWCYNYKTRIYFYNGKVVQIDD